MQLWCRLPPVLSNDEADSAQRVDSRQPFDPKVKNSGGASWRIGVDFELKRAGKGYRASLGNPFDAQPLVLEDHAPASGEAIFHPMAAALRWKKWLDVNPQLRPADAARNFGVTRATISLGLRLLDLQPEIEEFLLGLKDARAIHFFSRRRLLPLTSVSGSEQLIRFGQMQAIWQRKHLPPTKAVAAKIARGKQANHGASAGEMAC